MPSVKAKTFWKNGSGCTCLNRSRRVGFQLPPAAARSAAAGARAAWRRRWRKTMTAMLRGSQASTSSPLPASCSSAPLVSSKVHNILSLLQHKQTIVRPKHPFEATDFFTCDHRRKYAPPSRQACIAQPSTAIEACFRASERVGWGWHVRAMSSLLAWKSMATHASAMSSLASGPIICTPRIR